jgi:hypothetical protein
MAGPFELVMDSTVTVGAGREEVWEVLTGAADWPRWCDVCVEVTRAPATWAVGDSLNFRLRMAGVAVPFSVAVTECDRLSKLAWESTKYFVTATRTITLDDADGGTVVTDRKRFRSPVLPVRLIYPRWIVRAMTESWLADLKREAERRHSAGE